MSGYEESKLFQNRDVCLPREDGPNRARVTSQSSSRLNGDTSPSHTVGCRLSLKLSQGLTSSITRRMLGSKDSVIKHQIYQTLS